MTPWTSAEMTYRLLVGLGEDMIGYLFPPGNFLGSEGEVHQQPWLAYESANAVAIATASGTVMPTTPRASGRTRGGR